MATTVMFLAIALRKNDPLLRTSGFYESLITIKNMVPLSKLGHTHEMIQYIRVSVDTDNQTISKTTVETHWAPKVETIELNTRAKKGT
jgi:hypothetical protein